MSLGSTSHVLIVLGVS